MKSASGEEAEEKVLQMLEKENEAFDNHRLWRQLGVTPVEFFRGVKRHLGRLNVPEAALRRAVDSARAVSERKIREERGKAQRNPIPLGLIRV